MKTLHKLRSRAVAIFISCCAFLLVTVVIHSPAHADEPAIPQGSDAPALLKELAKATTSAQRISLAEKLAALGPSIMPELKTHLKRKRKSSEASRRSVLAATDAAVPDKTGRFKIPKRIKKSTQKKNDNFDWLAVMGKLSPRSGLNDVIVDIAIIRALAAMKAPDAGTIILDFAFDEIGIIYRDECGRYLRKMSPYSLPALIRGSQSRRDKSMSRYARFQLERVHRQNAHKALLSAQSEDLKIAILKAYADSQYREAVFAVLDSVDHSAPRVRKAARSAWLEFATGKEPPKPPERKLALPNGEHTRNKEPLWLDHRVLGDTAIRVRIKELTGSKPNKNASLASLTETLFGIYDDKREKETKQDFEAAKAMVSAGKAEQALPIFDRILAVNPQFSGRGEMVSAYTAVAEKLEGNEKWAEASVVYGKASSLAPDNGQANAALKKHHLTRAKAAGGKGEEAAAALELAKEVKVAPNAATDSPANSPSKVILFASLAAVAFAIILLLLGLSRQRQARA